MPQQHHGPPQALNDTALSEARHILSEIRELRQKVPTAWLDRGVLTREGVGFPPGGVAPLVAISERGASLTGKIVWHIAQSLDGFIAAPGGNVGNWISGHTFPGSDSVASAKRFGAILAGRTWHDECVARNWADVAPYGGAFSGPIFVLTSHPPASTPLHVTFTSAPIAEAIETARRAAEGKDVCLFGASIPHQAMNAGMLDEMVIHIVPVLLGNGRRLFEQSSGARPVHLQRRDDAANAAATLVFAPKS